MQIYRDFLNDSVTNADILYVLMAHGGFPGQVFNIRWERNATESRPDRWTYLYGDTDYKTYIRLERGCIDSKTMPARYVTPSEIEGDIYWSPADFCGKLRHAKYTQRRVCHDVGILGVPQNGACVYTTHFYPSKVVYTVCNPGKRNETSLTDELECELQNRGGSPSMLFASLLG